MSVMLCAFLVLGFNGDGWTTVKPVELVALEDSRRAIKTAHIEWNMRRSVGAIRGPHYFVSQVGGEDVVLVERGNADGVRTLVERDGEYVQLPQPPESFLYRDDEVWSYVDGELLANVRPRKAARPSKDVRNAGTSPVPGLSRRAGDIFVDDSFAAGAREYRVEREDGKCVVSMRHSNRASYVTRWTLDENQGYQPTSCEELLDGDVVRAVHTTYQRTEDGRWFPKNVEYVSGDGTTTCEIEITSVDIHDSERPGRLEPADIGIGNGVNIHYHAGHPKHEMPQIYCDGESLPIEKFLLRQRTVGVKPGEVFAREFPFLVEQYEAVVAARANNNSQDQVAASQPTTRPAGLFSNWEQYTLRFIATYELNEQQRQKALLVLGECQERGRAYVDRNKRQFEQSESKTRKGDAKAMKERERLMAPLESIFEKQLKPRLAKLTTRAQRKAAAKRAADSETKSKPSKTPAVAEP